MAQYALPRVEYSGTGYSYHLHRRYMQYPTVSMNWAIEREFHYRDLYNRGAKRVVLTWGWHKGSRPGAENYKIDPLEHCTFKVYGEYWTMFIGTYHGYPQNVFPADNTGRFQSMMDHNTKPGLSQVMSSIHNGHSRIPERSLYRQSLYNRQSYVNSTLGATLQNVLEEKCEDGSDDIFKQLNSNRYPSAGFQQNQDNSSSVQQSNDSAPVPTHSDSGSIDGRQRARVARPGLQKGPH